MLTYIDIDTSPCKKRLPKTLLDACHNILEVRLGNRVINGSTVSHTAQKAATLHQSQMVGCHWLGKFAGFGNVIDRIVLSGQ